MNTCIDCDFWSLWDGSCCHVEHDWAVMNPDTPACEHFEINQAEMELREQEKQNELH